jgi:hypothetical protein
MIAILLNDLLYLALFIWFCIFICYISSISVAYLTECTDLAFIGFITIPF